MKIIKKILILSFAFLLLAIATCFGIYFSATANTGLDLAKLDATKGFITLYDGSNKETATVSINGTGKIVPFREIPETVKNAFIAAEDKNFYKHRGLDLKGIARAAFKNLKSMSFKQGASTISQQLIKNTQLSSEKTLKRKLKEIKLTFALEKKYSKNEILEMYLNTIYFGHNCYGISNAADYYFSKNVSKLNCAESAMLAAIIRSPNNYSPFNHPDKCLTVRNSVLKRMKTLNFISEKEYKNAVLQELPVKKEREAAAQSYAEGVLNELEHLAIYSPYGVLNGCKIYTYLDPELQKYAEELNTEADRSGKSILICNNQTGGILTWHTTEGAIRRQPGSVLKPLAVYAPAVEENLIVPCTPILDSEINFNGYTPSNYKNEYHGYVSARTALAQSYNIPAVTLLNQLGIDKSEQYLERLRLPIDQKDRNLSLALGGLTDGFTVKEIASAYSVFSNDGRFVPCSFIRKIENADGNILYENKLKKYPVFSEDTAALINDMLLEAVKNGTAKKLSSLPFEICAKTGTCGTENGNTDAWTVSYTTKHTTAVWMGNADNTLSTITGGGLPCHYAYLLNKKIYAKKQPASFCIGEKTSQHKIDVAAYEQDHCMRLACERQPQKYTMTELFRKSDSSLQVSDYFRENAFGNNYSVLYKNNAIYIDLCHTQYYNYRIKRCVDGKTKEIYNGQCDQCFIDKNIESGKKYTYIVQPYYKSDRGDTICGKETVLPAVFTKKRISAPPSKWWENDF